MQILGNKNIILRALEPEDLDSLFDIENDVELWPISDTLAPFSRDLLAKYLQEADKDIFEAKQLRLAISPQGSRMLIGLVDLFQFDPHHSRAGLGIIIRSDHQEKGIATQAIGLMSQYAFRFLGLNQLFAQIPSNNLKSRRIFEKNGFSQSGILKAWMKENIEFRDVLIYQLLNPEKT